MARPRIHDETLRDQLIETAGEVIAGDGYTALNLRTLAKSAGTSTTAIYSLFGDKEGLLSALLAKAFQGFGDAQHAVGSSPDPIADLDSLAVAYRSWALANPHLFRVMFSGRLACSDPAIDAAAASTLQPLATTVTRGVTGGHLTGDPTTIVTALWSAVHGFVTLELEGLLPSPNPEGAFRATARAAAAGWQP